MLESARSETHLRDGVGERAAEPNAPAATPAAGEGPRLRRTPWSCISGPARGLEGGEGGPKMVLGLWR